MQSGCVTESRYALSPACTVKYKTLISIYSTFLIHLLGVHLWRSDRSSRRTDVFVHTNVTALKVRGNGNYIET